MSSAPVRGIAPQRLKRHHNQHHHHAKRRRHRLERNNALSSHNSAGQETLSSIINADKTRCIDKKEVGEERPKVNPIFLWAAQCEQRIIEVRCEDYDKRNRIRLTKTAQGWRSIPRTALTTHSTPSSSTEDMSEQHQTVPLAASKNEEKENTSQKHDDIGQEGAGVAQNGKVNDADRCGLWTGDRDKSKVRHKHKRKKHSKLWEDEREEVGSEYGKPGEALLNISWKMKKRRKLFKSKKRKKMCVKEEAVARSGINELGAIKIKEESKKDVNDRMAASEIVGAPVNGNVGITECANEILEPPSSEDDKKCLDLEKYQNNLHMQPRVVLEQLHLSQLPTKVHLGGINSRSDKEEHEGADEIGASRHIENIIEVDSCNDEYHVSPDSQDYPVNKDDLQEILNMLDSNNIPMNINGSKSSLIETKDLSQNCTKLGAVPSSTNDNDDGKISMVQPSDTICKSNLATSRKRSLFGERDSRYRVGSKSLDETIQRLEKSINYQKRVASIPNLLAVSKSNEDCQDKDAAEISTKTSSPVCEADSNMTFTEKDIVENSKILDALRKTPGMTVLLTPSDRKRSCSVTMDMSPKKKIPSDKSPDSQTELAGSKIQSPAQTSLELPPNGDQPKHIRKTSTVRIESPESTVNLKAESCSPESEVNELVEDEVCHSGIVEQTGGSASSRKQMRLTTHDTVSLDDFNGQGNLTKVHSSRLDPKSVYRNSEAQAKTTDAIEYTHIENTYNPNDEFHSHVSPQPSGIPHSISSDRRSSSTILERLLPSPPCSVSCSEDARNYRTLKTPLLSPLCNADSLIESGKEASSCRKGNCDVEPTPLHKHSHDEVDRTPTTTNQSTMDRLSQMFPFKNMGYLERRNHGRPMSSDNMQNPFVGDSMCPQRPLSADWSVSQQRMQSCHGYFMNNMPHQDEQYHGNHHQGLEQLLDPTLFLDPASQLRELIKTSGSLIPDPLLVPRDYLPLLASAPLTEIPRLLATRPELRLPEALSRPELLRDPDLLVISLAHLQHVLDHGDGSVKHQAQPRTNQLPPSPAIETEKVELSNKPVQEEAVVEKPRPKLSCKPIGKLMPAPMDLSNNCKSSLRTPLLRVRSGLLKQESEVSSTASSPDDSHLWHPLFGSQKQRQQHHQLQQQQRGIHQTKQPQQQQQDQQQPSWHRTTLAS